MWLIMELITTMTVIPAVVCDGPSCVDGNTLCLLHQGDEKKLYILLNELGQRRLYEQSSLLSVFAIQAELSLGLAPGPQGT